MGDRKSRPDRERRRNERRGEFVEAARRAVAEYGIGVSMDQIAAEAGVTKPVLYRHFRDKDDLYAAVAADFVQRLLAELATVLGDSRDPTELLRTGIDCYLAMVERDPDLYRFLTRSARNSVIDDLAGRVSTQIAVVVGEQLREARRDSGPAEAWAHGIVGMVSAVGEWWITNPVIPRAALVQYLLDLLWRGFAGMAPVRTDAGGAGRPS